MRPASMAMVGSCAFRGRHSSTLPEKLLAEGHDYNTALFLRHTGSDFSLRIGARFVGRRWGGSGFPVSRTSAIGRAHVRSWRTTQYLDQFANFRARHRRRLLVPKG